MDRILWLSSAPCPPDLRALLAAGHEILEFEDAESALRLTGGLPVAVAIVCADVPDVGTAIATLLAVRPEMQVLAATTRGVPTDLAQPLRAGARALVDLRLDRSETMRQLQEASAQHRRATGEREMLFRLRSLNEEFLRNIVAVEKRNIELAERLSAESTRLVSESLSLVPAEGVPERILVVDDEEVICDILQTVLSDAGYEVICAATAEAGIAEAGKRPFHLVLTDKNLPTLSGLDVLREVKALNPDTDVIMMTGYSSKESAIEALNLGASAYLEKPFEHIGIVPAKVDAVLSKQRERLKKRHYLQLIKERNKSFLEQYKVIRTDLEAWLQQRGVPTAPRVVPRPVKIPGTGSGE